MPALPKGFKAKDHDDMNDYSPVPKATYLAKIKKSLFKDTKSKKDGESENEFLEIHWEIAEGEFKGRIIFTILNLINESADAVEIANKELATIVRACGLGDDVDDSEELHGILCSIDVVVKKGKGDYSDKNEISMYNSADDDEKPKKGKKDKDEKKKKKDSPFKKGNKKKEEEPEEKDDDDDDDLDLTDYDKKQLVAIAVAMELGKKLKLKKLDEGDLIEMIEDEEEDDIVEAIESLDFDD